MSVEKAPADNIHPVELVGAGPGDPGLITLAGAEALKRAEVVLYDRLVAPSLLELAATAELISVGKAPGEPSTSQEEIHRLLIKHAQRGRRVVRLKGGDPFVFGRGGEEASALAAAEIPLRVIPGVSSATAAAAAVGIPVTDRRVASAVTVVTGSEGDGDAPPIDWDAVARVGGTIVVMMGWRNLDEIVRRLVDAGLSADTPAAAIAHAWTPRQQTVFAPLGALRERASEMRPPVTVILGEVTALAATGLAVRGGRRRVLVTRAAAQAQPLVERLFARNLEVVQLPTIEVCEVGPDGQELVQRAMTCLAEGHYDIVGLTSVNGVIQLWDALRGHGLDARSLAGTTVAAIGSETARALSERGIVADIVPTTFTSAALAARLTVDDLRGKRVLLARAAQAGATLRDRLQETGAEVDDVPLYDVVTPRAGEDALDAIAGGVDVVTLTSPSTVRGLVKLVGDRVDVDSLQAVCIGPVTADAARKFGLRVVATAETHTIDGLVDAVERYVAALDRSDGPESTAI